MLQIKNLSHFYDRDNPIINNFSLHLEKGDTASILGPSGCGKTTLLRIIAGLEKPIQGEITIGENLVFNQAINLPPEKRNLGLVVEDKALFPHLSVFKNIIFGIKGEKYDKERVNEYLELFKIQYLRNKYPHEISSGQQQRVALARAMITNPSVLLLDEPFSALDDELKSELYVETKNIFKIKKLTVFLVTHNKNEAGFFSHKTLVFKDNKIVEL
tara:strand:+ start:18999 stop:19643 length:645 start_codon:yes stop_codon:yes gene_type:complete